MPMGHFGGTFKKEMKEKYGIEVEIQKVTIAQKGKVTIHEKRWIVERTISWTLNNRRCSKDHERKTENANAYLTLANIRRLAKFCYIKQLLRLNWPAIALAFRE